MNPTLVQFILANKEGIITRWTEEIESNNDGINELVSISQKIIQQTNKKFIDILINNIQEDRSTLTNELKEFTEALINMGWPLSYITEGLHAFRRVILEYYFGQSDQSVDVIEALKNVDDWVNPVINQMIIHFSTTWQKTMTLQKMALEELSSPIIPLMENITVMPLIGTIDTDRAKKIMETLLDGVVKFRSEVVLIDITGVPVVDTMVAHHIVQAVEAVRLIGSKAILVGIRPEIAQTIVNLGIDLTHLPTKSTMRKGIESALEYTNRKIVPVQ